MLGNSQAALADAEAALDQDEEGKKDIRVSSAWVSVLIFIAQAYVYMCIHTCMS